MFSSQKPRSLAVGAGWDWRGKNGVTRNVVREVAFMPVCDGSQFRDGLLIAFWYET